MNNRNDVLLNKNCSRLFSHFYALPFFAEELTKYKARIEEALEKDFTKALFETTKTLIAESEDLMEVIEQLRSKQYDDPYTGFFCWAAKNDDDELFALTGFRQLFSGLPRAALLSVMIASLYNNHAYVLAAFKQIEAEPALMKKFLKGAAYMAIISQNHALLVMLDRYMQTRDIPFRELDLNRDQSKPYDWGNKDLLFTATRLENATATLFLLGRGFDPNHPACEVSYIGGCAFVACRCNANDIMAILYTHGANIEQRSNLGAKNTVLLEAVKDGKWQQAVKLVELFGADIYATDAKGVRAIDYVEDPATKNRLEKLYKQRTATVSGLSFMAGSKVSANTEKTEQKQCCLM